jgi:hypothetical protein
MAAGQGWSEMTKTLQHTQFHNPSQRRALRRGRGTFVTTGQQPMLPVRADASESVHGAKDAAYPREGPALQIPPLPEPAPSNNTDGFAPVLASN